MLPSCSSHACQAGSPAGNRAQASRLAVPPGRRTREWIKIRNIRAAEVRLPPAVARQARWARPVLAAEVAYLERTPVRAATPPGLARPEAGLAAVTWPVTLYVSWPLYMKLSPSIQTGLS